MNRDEAAKFLTVSLVTLNTWTKNQTIKAHRIGNRVYYKKSEIIDSLEEIGSRRKYKKY